MTQKLIKSFLVIIIIIASTNHGVSQGLSSKSFKSGEHLSYQASYNMSGVLTTFAEVNMTVGTVKTSKSSYLHLKCTANTYKKWDSFFKIRDLYEAYVSPYTITPAVYKRDNNENGTIRKECFLGILIYRTCTDAWFHGYCNRYDWIF